MKGLINLIQLNQRIEILALQILINLTDANVGGQCVDGVELKNLVCMVIILIAQRSHKRKYNNRTNLLRIRINFECFNILFRLFQVVVKNFCVLPGTNFIFLMNCDKLDVAFGRIDRLRICKASSETLLLIILIVSAQISLLSSWSLMWMSPQK